MYKNVVFITLFNILDLLDIFHFFFFFILLYCNGPQTKVANRDVSPFGVDRESDRDYNFEPCNFVLA